MDRGASRASQKSPRGPRGASSQAASPPDQPLRRSIFDSGSEPRKQPEPEKFAFQPSINPHSKEIVAAKGEPSTPIHDKLYQKKNDRERRRKRAQEEQLTKVVDVLAVSRGGVLPSPLGVGCFVRKWQTAPSNRT